MGLECSQTLKLMEGRDELASSRARENWRQRRREREEGREKRKRRREDVENVSDEKSVSKQD